MSERTTQTIDASEARRRFGELMGQVSRDGTRMLVEEGGVPVVAIVSAEDLARLTELERRRAARFAMLDEIQSRNVGADPEEVDRVVAEELAAMRQERREHNRAPSR